VSFAGLVLSILVGMLAGGLAGLALKRAGYRRRWDVVLGLAGGVAGSGSFLALGGSPETGVLAMAVMACAGGAIPIVLSAGLGLQLPGTSTFPSGTGGIT
jgi:hypothetical protein